ncbi:fumarylacetoacetate hydrolase family protein [Mycolicibacterium sp. CBM1]
MNDETLGMPAYQWGLARTRRGADSALVVWRRSGSPQAWEAVVDGRTFDDLPEVLAAAGGDPERISRGAPIDVPDEALLSPLGRPRKIVCAGRNYHEHAAEGGVAPPAYPDLFGKWDTGLVGPYDDVTLPAESEQIDYESELAVVIGVTCRRVAPHDVARVIFGYTVSNDVSVRDYQFHTSSRVAGKVWDQLTPLGPVVVPASGLGGAAPDLRITGRFDGSAVQDARTSQMIFSPTDLISYISTLVTLQPGDLILTGTPSGVGFVREPALLLSDGNRFEVDIEGIGTLSNRFVRQSD